MVDAYVRPAELRDADAIADIQLDVWRVAFADVLPAEALQVSSSDARAVWQSAIAQSVAPNIVLVAQEGENVVGFAAVSTPSADEPAAGWPSLSINPLAVMSRWTRRGHGSRLLAACADHARASGIDHVTTWLLNSDQVGLEFFREAGWEPDGCARSLDTGATTLTEVRLHASVSDEPPADA